MLKFLKLRPRHFAWMIQKCSSFPSQSLLAEGEDSDGFSYKDINEMWHKSLGSEGKLGSSKEWYKGGADYWKKVEANEKGVLGGYPEIGPPDIETSRELLLSLLIQGNIHPGRAIDCGGGIGRVSKYVLSDFFDEVDLVDQNEDYVDAAADYIGSSKMKSFYKSGLQDFKFEKSYDCIWIQWVLGNITDEDLPGLLKRCKEALSSKGVVIIKQNVHDDSFYLDKDDYSVVRSNSMFLEIFKKSEFQVLQNFKQPNLPEDLYDVAVYVLKPN